MKMSENIRIKITPKYFSREIFCCKRRNMFHVQKSITNSFLRFSVQMQMTGKSYTLSGSLLLPHNQDFGQNFLRHIFPSDPFTSDQNSIDRSQKRQFLKADFRCAQKFDIESYLFLGF